MKLTFETIFSAALLITLLGMSKVNSAEFVVITTSDIAGGQIIDEISPGVFTIGTLRSAIQQAEDEVMFPGGDIISFETGISQIYINQVGDTFDFIGQASDSGFGINSTITINGAAGIFGTVTLRATNQLRHFQVNSGGKLRLQNMSLRDGETPLNSAGRGGAIVVQNMGLLQLENCSIFENQAVNGGAIAFQSGAKESSITDSTFTNNESSDQNTSTENGAGGAIFAENTSATLTIENTTFSFNDADANGGAVYIDGLVNISRSRLFNNVSDWSGGGIYIDTFGTSTITNSIVDKNMSQTGGGGLDINSTNQISKIVSSTIAENESGIAVSSATKNSKAIKGITTRSGGIFSQIPGAFIIHNTIIAGNLVAGINNDFDAFVVGGSVNNLIGVSFGASTINMLNGFNGNMIGTLIQPIDPLLKYNTVGSTIQGLQSNSPAIHAGSDNEVIIEGLDTDYRGDGFDRIYGPATDIGAFEFDDDFVFINGFE